MVRGGPGLGSIQPAQSDYFQSTRGGGHGDYRLICFAPANVQEAVDLMGVAFDLADQYRNPVMLLGDGMLGQIMEPVQMPEPRKEDAACQALGGWSAESRPSARLSTRSTSIPLPASSTTMTSTPSIRSLRKRKIRWRHIDTEDADVIVVAYGTMARVCMRAAKEAKEKLGLKVGIVRPITVWPYPYKAVFDAANQPSVKEVVSIEMSCGQMVDDVKIAVNGVKPVSFYGRTGGVVPTVKDILNYLSGIKEGK